MTDFDTELRQALRDFAEVPAPPAYDAAAIHRATRRRSRAAVAVSAAAVVAIAGTAAALTGADHSGPRTLATPTASPETVSRFGDELIHFYLPASGAQDTDGYRYLQAVARQSAFIQKKCLTDQGLTVPEGHRYTGTEDPSGMNFYLPDLDRVRREGRLTGLVQTQGYRTDSRTERALDTCARKAQKEFEPIAAIGRELRAAWWAKGTLAGQRDPRVVELLPAFKACAVRKGAPYPSKIKLGSPGAAFAGYMDAVSRMNEAADARKASLIFADCARPVVKVLDSVQADRQAAFLRTHAQQIDDLKTTADETFARIEKKWGKP